MGSSANSKTYNSSGRRRVRVFLEGREVPVINVAIVCQMNMPVMANIELVPLGVIKRIRPRTQVHVFVRDNFTFGDNEYYLAYEGEVMGRSMMKRTDSRAFRITAYDYSNYWDDTKAFVMNPNFIAGKLTQSIMMGEPAPGSKVKADGAADTIPVSANVNSLMIDYLLKYKDESGAPDIIRGVSDIAKRLATVNEFYRSAYERLRVLDRIRIQSSGRLGKFLSGLKVEEFLASYTGAQGGMVSLRQMLMGILSLFFHEGVSLPFPSFVKTTDDKGQTGHSLSQFLFIPDTFLLPPPRCNVVFPNQQMGFDFDEDFRAAPTRYGFRCSFPIYATNTSNEATYPIQYYPRPFADYMGNLKGDSRLSTSSDLSSMVGPSKLLVGSDGQSYANLHYGQPSKDKTGKAEAVGTSYTPTLRESDFLTNEESLKGIYYDTDVLPAAYSTLVRSGRVVVDSVGKVVKNDDGSGVEVKTRNEFIRDIGAYLFFKKRYASRQVSAHITFNPFLVPGFNALFLDDSEAGQSFIAKVQGITHNLNHEHFTTSVNLGLGRDFDEVDLMSGGTGDPPLPPWFESTLYGAIDEEGSVFSLETKFLGPPSSKIQGTDGAQGVIGSEEVKFRNENVKNPTVFTSLDKFYEPLLGCGSITELGPAPTKPGQARRALVTTRGAVQYLVATYKNKGGQVARDAFVRSYTNRPIATMREAFSFLGAGASGSNIPDEFAKFTAITDPNKTGLPGRFDGVDAVTGKSYSDKLILQIRREVVDAYISQLKAQRGFRG